jgi:hypothetical protein
MKSFSLYLATAALLFAGSSARSTSPSLRARKRKNRSLQQPQYYDERCFGFPADGDNDDVACDPKTFGNCFEDTPTCAAEYQIAIQLGNAATCNFMVSYNNVTSGISNCVGWQVSCCDSN